jgi:ribosomal protein L11 methyltransferase
MTSAIKQFVLESIGRKRERWTSRGLQNAIAKKFKLPARQAAAAIKDLVTSGELTYTYEHGHSFLEKSFNRPVRVADQVVLKPPGISCDVRTDDIVIELAPGAAFGNGAHPSTQLALRGIVYAVRATDCARRDAAAGVLDIGTGSGILVIAAVKLGLQRGLGIDIDPCARVEANANVRINRLAAHVVISDRSVETLDRPFGMVTANLRYPTLARLRDKFEELVAPKGVAVLSGLTAQEVPHLLAEWRPDRWKPLWQAEDREWGCLVIQKK